MSIQGFTQSLFKRRMIVAALIISLLALVAFVPLGLVRADFTYTVKAGDNLSKIAKLNNTTVEALVAANKAKYPCLATTPACLQIGWVLSLSGSGSAPSAANGPSTYTVQSGDSLAKIAKKLGVGFSDLIAANKKDRPCLAAATPCALQIGWVLNVPGGAAPAAAPTATAVAPTASPATGQDLGTATATGTPSNYGTLAVLMCGGIEASVTIFHDGQIVTQGSLHRDQLNLYALLPGHYDVQYSATGYSNYNRSYDIAAGDLIIEPFGTC